MTTDSSRDASEHQRDHERTILEMAYDVNAFHSVVPRERPDFALQFRDGDLPFGVEITQLFPDESHARPNLVDGYAQQLSWRYDVEQTLY